MHFILICLKNKGEGFHIISLNALEAQPADLLLFILHLFTVSELEAVDYNHKRAFQILFQY